ncbi:putative secondary metabolism biosynthetic enzyme [Sporothrix bragantina]|uniref:Secondary metabolism biosynthetic enzyme n=1 Tax=Sporothrix bragantina TaxID=671064 RepID=A0ABP0CP46_9PEZI
MPSILTLPREGFTVDYVARFLRYTLLNPVITLPVVLALYLEQLYLGSSSIIPDLPEIARQAKTPAAFLACFSVILSLTDYLNRGFNNNWVGKSNWQWAFEIVVITGGSSGIGATIAQQLLAKNSQTTIVIIDYVPLTWTPPVGSRTRFYRCDLSDTAAIRTTCATIKKEVGNPSVLVNNAGLSRGASIMDGSYADNEITIKTNLLAPFLLIKEFLPEMVRKNHGHIVNVSSMSAIMPPGKLADYAATKAGLIAMHEALQLEIEHTHNAPKVRQTLAILSFTLTPLFKGETRQSAFLFPLLHVESVSEAIVEALYSGYGKTIYMPGIMRYVSSLRGGPEWVQRIIRQGTEKLGVDFKGRQKIDAKTGKLCQ